LYLQTLWRYPVKSLGGEQLDAAELTPDGIAGDRLVHVSTPDGPLTRPEATLRAYDGPERFDVLNLLVATDSAISELGTDVRH
jgi:uncharacterized protein